MTEEEVLSEVYNDGSLKARLEQLSWDTCSEKKLPTDTLLQLLSYQSLDCDCRCEAELIK